jgi:hypothetical protein
MNLYNIQGQIIENYNNENGDFNFIPKELLGNTLFWDLVTLNRTKPNTTFPEGSYLDNEDKCSQCTLNSNTGLLKCTCKKEKGERAVIESSINYKNCRDQYIKTRTPYAMKYVSDNRFNHKFECTTKSDRQYKNYYHCTDCKVATKSNKKKFTQCNCGGSVIKSEYECNEDIEPYCKYCVDVNENGKLICRNKKWTDFVD